MNYAGFQRRLLFAVLRRARLRPQTLAVVHAMHVSSPGQWFLNLPP